MPCKSIGEHGQPLLTCLVRLSSHLCHNTVATAYQNILAYRYLSRKMGRIISGSQNCFCFILHYLYFRAKVTQEEFLIVIVALISLRHLFSHS